MLGWKGHATVCRIFSVKAEIITTHQGHALASICPPVPKLFPICSVITTSILMAIF